MGRPHGLDGYLGLYVEEADLVHFQPGAVVRIGARALRVRAVRKADRGHQIAFEGIDDRPSAEQIRNLEVAVEERRALEPGEYWPSELIGLEVRPMGGVVVGVEHGPTQARLVVERGGHRFEVPFVEALVPVVDTGGGYVEVADLPGLMEPSG